MCPGAILCACVCMCSCVCACMHTCVCPVLTPNQDPIERMLCYAKDRRDLVVCVHFIMTTVIQPHFCFLIKKNLFTCHLLLSFTTATALLYILCYWLSCRGSLNLIHDKLIVLPLGVALTCEYSGGKSREKSRGLTSLIM